VTRSPEEHLPTSSPFDRPTGNPRLLVELGAPFTKNGNYLPAKLSWFVE
jgi:hypothetical protein